MYDIEGRMTDESDIANLTDLNKNDFDGFLSGEEVVSQQYLMRSQLRKNIAEIVEKKLIKINKNPKKKRYKILIVAPFRDNNIVETSSYSVTEFINGVLRYIEENDVDFVPEIIHHTEFLENINSMDLTNSKIAGVIFFSNVDSLIKSESIFKKKKIPMLFYGSSINLNYFSDSSSYYVYDQVEIVEKGLNYLFEKGHKNLGICYSDTFARVQRYEIFTEIMAKRGVDLYGNSIINMDDYFYKGYLHQDSLKYFLNRLDQKPIPKDVTAFFCVDDNIAMYFMNAIIKYGYKIPDDLALLGVGNYPYCQNLKIPLTSVEIPFYNDGYNCIEKIIKLTGKNEPHVRLKSLIRIITRKSA